MVVVVLLVLFRAMVIHNQDGSIAVIVFGHRDGDGSVIVVRTGVLMVSS